MKGGSYVDYPFVKLCFNRLTNWMIAVLFAKRYTDTTNAFKLYRKDTLEGLKPYLSHHFKLIVEPLEVDRTWLYLQRTIESLDESKSRRIKT